MRMRAEAHHAVAADRFRKLEHGYEPMWVGAVRRLAGPRAHSRESAIPAFDVHHWLGQAPRRAVSHQLRPYLVFP